MRRSILFSMLLGVLGGVTLDFLLSRIYLGIVLIVAVCMTVAVSLSISHKTMRYAKTRRKRHV